MKTVLFQRWMTNRYFILFQIAFLVMVIHAYGFAGNSSYIPFSFLYLLSNFNDSKGLEYMLPISKKDKFVATLVESTVVVSFIGVGLVGLAVYKGINLMDTDLLFASVMVWSIYNLVQTMPPTILINWGWRLLIILTEFSTVIFVMLAPPLSSYRPALFLAWFLIFYWIHFHFYTRLGHQHKGGFYETITKN